MSTQQLRLPIPESTAPERSVVARFGGRVSHRTGFWMVAYAFAVLMAFSAVPTPLYVLYARRDHFSSLTSTLIYAAYALGVIGSLFLLGHVSDWVGRRRVLLPAIVASMASGVIFIVWQSVPSLVIARILSGVAVGMVTGTATAHLGELHAASPPRPLAAPRPAGSRGGEPRGHRARPARLRPPRAVRGASAPRAVPGLRRTPPRGGGGRGARAGDGGPPARARCVPAPAHRGAAREVRGQFAAAAIGGLVTFAVLGLFTSLAPAFLAGTLHDSSHAVAGAVAFGVFAAAATAQIALLRLGVRSTLAVGIALLPIGLGVLSAATWFADLPAFVVGGIVTGAGAGLVFKGVLATSMGLAPHHARAEVLAGLFLASYIGLSVPIVILGIAGQYVSTRAETAVFAAAVTLAVLATATKLLAPTGRAGGARRGLIPGPPAAGQRPVEPVARGAWASPGAAWPSRSGASCTARPAGRTRTAATRAPSSATAPTNRKTSPTELTERDPPGDGERSAPGRRRSRHRAVDPVGDEGACQAPGRALPEAAGERAAQPVPDAPDEERAEQGDPGRDPHLAEGVVRARGHAAPPPRCHRDRGRRERRVEQAEPDPGDDQAGNDRLPARRGRHAGHEEEAGADESGAERERHVRGERAERPAGDGGEDGRRDDDREEAQPGGERAVAEPLLQVDRDVEQRAEHAHRREERDERDAGARGVGEEAQVEERRPRAQLPRRERQGERRTADEEPDDDAARPAVVVGPHERQHDAEEGAADQQGTDPVDGVVVAARLGHENTRARGRPRPAAGRRRRPTATRRDR